MSNSWIYFQISFSFVFLYFLETHSIFSKYLYMKCQSRAEMGRLPRAKKQWRHTRPRLPCFQVKLYPWELKSFSLWPWEGPWGVPGVGDEGVEGFGAKGGGGRQAVKRGVLNVRLYGGPKSKTLEFLGCNQELWLQCPGRTQNWFVCLVHVSGIDLLDWFRTARPF